MGRNKRKEWRETGQTWEKARKVRKNTRNWENTFISLQVHPIKALKQVKEGGFEKANSANLGREEKLEEKQ